MRAREVQDRQEQQSDKQYISNSNNMRGTRGTEQHGHFIVEKGNARELLRNEQLKSTHQRSPRTWNGFALLQKRPSNDTAREEAASTNFEATATTAYPCTAKHMHQ